MSSNTSNLSCGNITEYTPAIGVQEVVHISLQSLIFCFGLAGNLILLSIIVSQRNLRTTPNLFISNLAVADCIYLLLFVPCDIASNFGLQLPTVFCKTLYFCRILTVGVSVYTLLAMAIDRCLAITRPLSTLKSSRPNLVPRLGLGAIWLLATALAVPYAVGSHIETNLHQLPHGNCLAVRSCFPFPREWGSGYSRAMRILKLLAYYAVPGLLTVLFYGLMAGRLLRSARQHGQANSSTAGQAEGRRKLAKLVLCLALVFFIAWGPDHAITLYFFMAKQVSGSFLRFKMIAKLLPSAYSASNPVTLCIISKRFRAHFLQVITCGRRAVNEGGTTGAGTQYRSGAGCRAGRAGRNSTALLTSVGGGGAAAAASEKAIPLLPIRGDGRRESRDY
ncbi:hypothetical protein BOX15_Mlig005910g1 [Macrostomum lignano]|uniref:G-protein coupled receptors family 1 profile domain-containing protein n=2 Tax=Macrostomum lignano TaxID=282301 RepID=A0A267F5N7_9PLAT|nr:hypothetical protein BOX15_Mlig005910g1 [Macrostomum lignano]